MRLAEDPRGKPKMEQNIRNCPNCSASRTGAICKYCGTVFYKLDYIQAKQSEIKKIEAEINKLKFANSLFTISSCWFPDYRRY